MRHSSSSMASQLPLSMILAVVLALQYCAPTTRAHNITRMLASHPSFSTFNKYLTLTHLAGEINRRRTITVCALDNAAMSDIVSRGYSIYTIRNILSLHVLVDYYSAKKLRRIDNGTTLTSTLFQATGMAPGNSGYANLTDLGHGKVGIRPADNGGNFTSFFVKSVIEKPYNISIIQISHELSSPEADAPTPSPSSLHLTSVLASKGCKAFSTLLTATDAAKTFQENIDAGLTVFCVSDAAVGKFMPKYRNLSTAGKLAVLLYHGVPSYNSMGMLQTPGAAGVMNTLATAKAGEYDFAVESDGNAVMLETRVVSAKVTGTLLDEDPLSIYKLDKVLLPRELFKAEEAAPGEDNDEPAAEKNGAWRVGGGVGWAAVLAGVVGGVVVAFL